MAGTDPAFNKVRSILGKMDRSITDARKRRLGEADDSPSHDARPDDDLLIGRAEDTPQADRPATDEPQQVSEMRARYGKAKPISRPTHTNGTSNGTSNGTTNGTSNGAGGHHDDNGPLNFHAKPA